MSAERLSLSLALQTDRLQEFIEQIEKGTLPFFNTCGHRTDAIQTLAVWREPVAAVADWSTWLGEGDWADQLTMFAAEDRQGGSLAGREASRAGRPLSYRPVGRPRHEESQR